ncbi:ATP-binding protein [Streptomyces sp. NPDC047097]|uniref:ATP-binding protein n=1 Tax=Streptomyces sp. NPDC047097 TaxID=3155260 RepID=UPI0034058DD9
MVVEVPPCADSASAREATARFLAEYCPWADVSAVQLVVTELTANALRHAGSRWRLRLGTAGDELSVEVDDSSPAAPEPRAPDFSGGGGFGWHLVQALASRLEVRPHAAGKTIRAVWARSRPAAVAAA